LVLRDWDGEVEKKCSFWSGTGGRGLASYDLWMAPLDF
jgi:hypothetical protein